MEINNVVRPISGRLRTAISFTTPCQPTVKRNILRCVNAWRVAEQLSHFRLGRKRILPVLRYREVMRLRHREGHVYFITCVSLYHTPLCHVLPETKKVEIHWNSTLRDKDQEVIVSNISDADYKSQEIFSAIFAAYNRIIFCHTADLVL